MTTATARRPPRHDRHGTAASLDHRPDRVGRHRGGDAAGQRPRAGAGQSRPLGRPAGRRAQRRGQAPPAGSEIDHRSPATYRSYASASAAEVRRASRRSASALIDELTAVSDDDLSDTSRHPWLRGRQLWLQVVVRGFWHPTGHLADYHIARGHADRAVALQSHALATARYLAVPSPAVGMAAYSLTCALAQAGAAAEAARTLAEAIRLNPDLRGNARRDPDLAGLRDGGHLDMLLGPAANDAGP